ncbi:MAG: glycoside hydrolase family 9 protein [Prolixibacteraceae bacterium]
MIHFDDGKVIYPNDLQVDRLDLASSMNPLSYTISSTDDVRFSVSENPTQVNRKTKGTEYVSNSGVVWPNGSADPRSKPWASEHWLYLELDKVMQKGKTYTIETGSLAKNGSKWVINFDEKNYQSDAIHLNTLGFASDAPKYGYIYHWAGDRGNVDLEAYENATFSIYNLKNLKKSVKTGTIQFRKPFDNPETDKEKDTPNKNFLGADVYDCNFTDLKEEGNYILVVEGIGSSYPFKIGKDPVWDAYYHTARGLYHQRSGIRLAPPYTADDYIRPVTQNPKVTSDDGISYKGKQFYSQMPYMEWSDDNSASGNALEIIESAKDYPIEVAGWYHDAGDWDGYYTHQRIPILLMTTFEYVPECFGDDELNIPESGNGIPDLIDEASWLIKFNYRLRKELLEKGYCDGGVGGARVCSDIYSSVDENTEHNDGPSWQEKRRLVVSQADAFMTYFYAGQAAQFAMILKKLGENPNAWPVELLDAVEFKDMSYDTVDWVKEAEEAFAWAVAEKNQPKSNNNYSNELSAYRSYAAANLYRITGKKMYHDIAKNDLNYKIPSGTFVNDAYWGLYSYLLADNFDVDQELKKKLEKEMLDIADIKGADRANDRACRWGNIWDYPMLVGQGSTPTMFSNVVAYSYTGDKKYYNTIHTTADYYLGGNPLHTTWITGVGPRGLHAVFHLDSRHIYDDWKTYPGQIPYGPWSLEYGYTPYYWEMDGDTVDGGNGPWHHAWWNFSTYPDLQQWPGHERLSNNIHSPMSMEFTIHQNTVHAALSYGFVNSRAYKNANSAHRIKSIQLNKKTLELNDNKYAEILFPTLNIDNATFSLLKWKSSNEEIARVDSYGRVTAIGNGICKISCSSFDGSVKAICKVKTYKIKSNN